MDFVHNPYRCGPLRVGRYDLATVNLVMRSVLQTRTQPTQQYCCPLYRLELNYTYWLHQLYGPSCHCLPPRVNKELVLPYP